MVDFGPIIHHSAGNDQFDFHTFLLESDTSTFTTGRVHYGQLILYLTIIYNGVSYRRSLKHYIFLIGRFANMSVVCK